MVGCVDVGFEGAVFLIEGCRWRCSTRRVPGVRVVGFVVGVGHGGHRIRHIITLLRQIKAAPILKLISFDFLAFEWRLSRQMIECGFESVGIV